MKPIVDEEGNKIEEFFWCVEGNYYTEEDFTLVTNEYKEAYEAEHYPPEPEPEPPTPEPEF
jgi:hypothetical protein